MARWRVELLGGLRVQGDDTLLTHFETRKTTALLALLVLNPERVHPREELAAALWPEAEWESARNRLKQALAALRKRLGPLFETSHFGIRLSSDQFETDVAQWETLVRAGRLREAAALWRGELLPGYYEDPILQERERLNALHAQHFCADVPETSRLVRLPAPLTRFVGRVAELGALATQLQSERWITLTGPGGIGKTRLAIEVARGHEHDDVTFLELAELHEAGQVPGALARALELTVTGGQPPLEVVCTFLRERPMLLVLDNAEHLERERLAPLCQQLLERLPQLRLLVTSRQPLGGAGERRFLVPTLPHEADAVALFLERAQRCAPGLVGTEDITTICRLLEGIPLAIELCAAWSVALTPKQIRERLERGERARLLTGRDATLPERHRSVEAAFLGSYERLTETQQRLLRGLTVFRGGWSLEGAESVCPTDDTLADLLALVEASLVQSHAGRFSLLESLRDQAARLLTPEERHAVVRAHGAWCLALLVRQPDEQERDWLARCGAERANFQAALEDEGERGGDPEERLVLALQLFWNLRGENEEATRWLERALTRGAARDSVRAELLCHLGGTLLEQRNQFDAERSLHEAQALTEAGEPIATGEHTKIQAQVLYHLGRFAELQRQPELAWERHTRALELRRVVEDVAGIARSCNMLAQLAIQRGDFAPVGALLAEADQRAQEAGRESLRADILYQRAHYAMMSGDPPGALSLLEECLVACRALGLRMLQARVTHSLGCTALELGDEPRARSAFLEAARTFQALRAKLGTHFPLWYLARLYSSAEEWDIVLLTLGSAMRLWDDLARPLAPEEAALLAQLRAQAEVALGGARADHLWQEGQSLRIEEIIARVERRPLLKHSHTAV